MSDKSLKVLVLSDLFPNPAFPAFGNFVERQMHFMKPYCEIVVVAPVRVFPHLSIWRKIAHPRKFKRAWQKWRFDLAKIPDMGKVNGQITYYPRYTSPPRQVFHSLWGFFAYPFLNRLLHELYSQNKFNLIHAHYASPSGVIALQARRWMGVPVVLSIHGSDLHFTIKQNRMGKKIIQRVFHNVNTIVAQSTWTREQIVRNGGDPKRVSIVRLGALPIVQQQHIDNEKKSETIDLLTVGYLRRPKGHAFVLRAIAELIKKGHKLHYVIVGDGPEWHNLQSLAVELGIQQHVTFEGFKRHEEVWPYYKNCDIFVLPSWIEAFGLVYIEALSMAKPAIGCKGAGGPEDLKKLGNCIELIKPQDVESLERALCELIVSPEKRQKMGALGQKIVKENFDWENNAQDLLAVYKNALETYHA